jgi:hypothetical protein
MKDIDAKVAQAVMYGDWLASCNTIVSWEGSRFTVVLHGNVIAKGHRSEEGEPVVDFATFAGHYTNVTIRRLNAIGVDTKELARKEKVGRYGRDG